MRATRAQRFLSVRELINASTGCGIRPVPNRNLLKLRQQREREAKKQADLKSSETNLLKKLDWNVNDEQDLI